MPRCSTGKALCLALGEISSDQARWDTLGVQQLTGGRTSEQLALMRRKIAAHDAGCFVCNEGRMFPDADPADESNQGDT